MSSYFDLKLTPTELIAGNSKIGTETYRVVQHAQFRDGIALMVHAKRDETGEWQLVERSTVGVAGCFDPDAVQAMKAVEESDSDWDANEGEDGQICFSRLLETH